MLLPFEHKEGGAKQTNLTVLAADAGATKTNLAIFKYENDQAVVLREAKYNSREYFDIVSLLNQFLKGMSRPDVICLAVAGPVLNGHARPSNIDWEIDSHSLSTQLGIDKIYLINDLEATAYGLATLTEKDLLTIHAASENIPGNAAIIAPGTGLGEASLYFDGKVYHPFATEGGHCDFAPRNEFDFELYTFLQKEFGHVSWERLTCGPGILNIYRFLRDIKKQEEPRWLKERLTGPDAAALISGHITESPICRETMRLFIRYLAFESANLVLKVIATGGLFIGGGIVPQIAALLEDSDFYSSFCQSGRLNYLLEKVPVKIILNAKAALLGAAYYAYNN